MPLVSYVVYLEQLFYPVGLAVYYPHPTVAVPVGTAVAAFLLMASIFLVAAAMWKRCPYLLVGWLWYVGMLVPVIGLVQVGEQSRADRYTYLTQIGLYIALAWGISHISRHWPDRRWVCGVTSAVVVVLLTLCAWQQTSYWHNSESLWTRDLVCAQASGLAHNNLGLALAARGHNDEAIAHYRKALEITPDYALAHNNLGNALAQRGQIDEAIAHYQKAVGVQSHYADAHYNLGNALALRGQTDDAIAHFKRAIEITPDNSQAHINLGLLLAGRGQIDEAIAHYRKSLEIDPDNPNARNGLNWLLSTYPDASFHTRTKPSR